MPNNFAGLGDFTAALTGGGGIRENAYKQELTGLADTYRKMAEADMARNQTRAQVKLAELNGGAFGLNDPQSDVMRTVLQAGGGNANSLAGGIGQLFETARRHAAQQAAAGGDMGAANAELMGVTSAPVPTVDIDAGQILRDRFSNTPTVAPTDETAAQIMALAALAAQRRASADASQSQAAASAARADLYGRTDPNRPRGKAAANYVPQAGDQTSIIEAEIGRPLSAVERQQIASGTLNLQAPAAEEMRKIVRGKSYVKRGGQWFEE